MSYGYVRYTPLLSIAGATVTGSYAPLGTTLEAGRIMAYINGTDANVLLSFNGTDDHIFLMAGSAQIWDYQSNAVDEQTNFAMPVGTVIYIKSESGDPTTGSVYVELAYSKPI